MSSNFLTNMRQKCRIWFSKKCFHGENNIGHYHKKINNTEDSQQMIEYIFHWARTNLHINQDTWSKNKLLSGNLSPISKEKISNLQKGATKKITVKTSHFLWSYEKIRDPLTPSPNFTLISGNSWCQKSDQPKDFLSSL